MSIFTIIVLACAFYVVSTKVDAADFKLAPGPYQSENLGSLIQSDTQEHQIMVRLTNGDVHLFMHYVAPTEGWLYKTKLLDVNLTQKNYHLVDEAVSRPGPAIYYSDDKVFFTTGDPQSHLIEYNPLTGDAREIGLMAKKTAGPGGAIGDDGAVYFGSCCNGKVTRYDPGTGTITDFDRMDPESTSTYQYAYTVAADDRYVYTGLGQSPWYLAILDRETGQKTVYWKDDVDSCGTVGRGAADGKIYYTRCNLTSYNSGGWYRKYYKLENGVPVEIEASQYPTQDSNYYGNMERTAANFPTKFGYEVDLGDAIPDNLTGSQATIRFRQVGETDWDSMTVTGFNLRPVNIKRLYDFGGGKLFGFADFYGPVFNYDIASNETIGLGHPLYSLYDGLFYDSSNVYLSGYPAATLRYNPQKPWTLVSSVSNIYDTSVNPYHTPASYGKYSYYSAKGSDGLVYIGAHHERDSTGGELGWYDPESNKSLGSLRDPFLEYDVRDLKPALDGTKIIYSSAGDKLFVFDVATKSIEREIQPLGSGAQLDKIVEVSPGVILGDSVNPSNKIFEVDVRTGEILFTKDLPGTNFFTGVMSYDRRLTLGPDGYVWVIIDNDVARIDPSDGSLQTVLNTQNDFGFAASGFRLLFSDGNLYFYGTADLRRVKNVLTMEAILADLNADLKVDLSDFNILKSDFFKLTANLVNPKSDINQDGQCTVRDAGIMMHEWKP